MSQRRPAQCRGSIMKRSTVVAIFVVLFGLGASALALWSAQRSKAPLNGAPVAATKVAGGQRGSLSRVGWDVGTEYTHAVEYHVALGPDSEPRQAAQSFDLRARGNLRSLVYE